MYLRHLEQCLIHRRPSKYSCTRWTIRTINRYTVLNQHYVWIGTVYTSNYKVHLCEFPQPILSKTAFIWYISGCKALHILIYLIPFIIPWGRHIKWRHCHQLRVKCINRVSAHHTEAANLRPTVQMWKRNPGYCLTHSRVVNCWCAQRPAPCRLPRHAEQAGSRSSWLAISEHKMALHQAQAAGGWCRLTPEKPEAGNRPGWTPRARAGRWVACLGPTLESH